MPGDHFISSKPDIYQAQEIPLVVGHIYTECKDADITSGDIYAQLLPATPHCRRINIEPTGSARIEVRIDSFHHRDITLPGSRAGLKAAVYEEYLVVVRERQKHDAHTIG